MNIGGRPNMNGKFKTFGFLDTLKVHIQSNYLTSTTLSLLQTKLAKISVYRTKWGHCPPCPPCLRPCLAE